MYATVQCLVLVLDRFPLNLYVLLKSFEIFNRTNVIAYCPQKIGFLNTVPQMENLIDKCSVYRTARVVYVFFSSFVKFKFQTLPPPITTVSVWFAWDFDRCL